VATVHMGECSCVTVTTLGNPEWAYSPDSLENHCYELHDTFCLIYESGVGRYQLFQVTSMDGEGWSIDSTGEQ